MTTLAARHHGHARALAGAEENRFSELSWEHASRGALLVSGTAARMYCRLEAELGADNHMITLLWVEPAEVGDDVPPLALRQPVPYLGGPAGLAAMAQAPANWSRSSLAAQ